MAEKCSIPVKNTKNSGATSAIFGFWDEGQTESGGMSRGANHEFFNDCCAILLVLSGRFGGRDSLWHAGGVSRSV